MAIGTLSPLGQLLRYWRGVRKLSQLDVALQAEVSARHLSFVETGRAQPSRQMVLLLAEVLDVPLRERNAMLQAAGFVAAYRQTDLDAPELLPVRRSIEFLLERHNPYPAVVVDRHWNLLLQNRAAMVALPRFIANPGAFSPPVNVMRLLFHPDGARPFIANWDEIAGVMIQRLAREAVAATDEPTRALLEEALGTEGMPARFSAVDLGSAPPLVVPMRFVRDQMTLSLFSAITTLGTPQDITLQELRLETFFPADEPSDELLRSFAADERV
jgi:transcriptional regulator with XRE-family HTH domain